MTIEAATCGILYWRMFRARPGRNTVGSDNSNKFVVKMNAFEVSVKENRERAQNSGVFTNFSVVKCKTEPQNNKKCQNTIGHNYNIMPNVICT